MLRWDIIKDKEFKLEKGWVSKLIRAGSTIWIGAGIYFYSLIYACMLTFLDRF